MFCFSLKKVPVNRFQAVIIVFSSYVIKNRNLFSFLDSTQIAARFKKTRKYTFFKAWVNCS